MATHPLTGSFDSMSLPYMCSKLRLGYVELLVPELFTTQHDDYESFVNHLSRLTRRSHPDKNSGQLSEQSVFLSALYGSRKILSRRQDRYPGDFVLNEVYRLYVKMSEYRKTHNCESVVLNTDIEWAKLIGDAERDRNDAREEEEQAHLEEEQRIEREIEARKKREKEEMQKANDRVERDAAARERSEQEGREEKARKLREENRPDFVDSPASPTHPKDRGPTLPSESDERTRKSSTGASGRSKRRSDDDSLRGEGEGLKGSTTEEAQMNDDSGNNDTASSDEQYGRRRRKSSQSEAASKHGSHDDDDCDTNDSSCANCHDTHSRLKSMEQLLEESQRKIKRLQRSLHRERRLRQKSASVEASDIEQMENDGPSTSKRPRSRSPIRSSSSSPSPSQRRKATYSSRTAWTEEDNKEYMAMCMHVLRLRFGKTRNPKLAGRLLCLSTAFIEEVIDEYGTDHAFFKNHRKQLQQRLSALLATPVGEKLKAYHRSLFDDDLYPGRKTRT